MPSIDTKHSSQATLIPTRLNSLALLSTAARLINTIGFFANLRNRITMFLPKSLDTRIAYSKTLLYSPAYLAGPDSTEYVVAPFPTAGDRFAAGEISKRKDPSQFTTAGFMAQAVAAGWHHKSREQMEVIGEKVGRRRILVVHGEEDRMITVPHGRTLIEELNAGGKGESDVVEGVIFEGQGHVIPVEKREEVGRLLEELVQRGRELNGGA